MGHRYASILETVGNTPVVKINRLAPPGVNLYVKVEAFNPLGSVKDRLALGVIEEAARARMIKIKWETSTIICDICSLLLHPNIL